MGDKHVFENDVTEWYVAYTREGAAALAMEHDRLHGLDGGDYAFRLVPDERELIKDGVKKTAKQWAEESPLGFLMSTEY